MNMLEKSKNEQLDIAKNSTCSKELHELHRSKFMNVRRAVARNVNITTDIANTLSTDPVLNVSYMALQNPKSTITRDICKSTITGCVLCEKDERHLECVDCANKNKSAF